MDAVELLLASEDFYCWLGNVVIDLGIAKVVHNSRYKQVFSANHVRGINLPRGTDIKGFVLDIEELLQDKGVDHSLFFIDRRTVPESLRLVLSDCGYRLRPEVGLLLEGEPLTSLNPYVQLVEATGGVWWRQFISLLRERKMPEPLRSQSLSLKLAKLSHPSLRPYVVYVGSEPAGTVSVLSFRGLARVKDFYIRAEFGEKGVAETAIKQLARLARRDGNRMMGVLLYPTDPLVAMYKKMGFCEASAVSWFVLDKISQAG